MHGDDEQATSSTLSLGSIKSVWLEEVLSVVQSKAEKDEASNIDDPTVIDRAPSADNGTRESHNSGQGQQNGEGASQPENAAVPKKVIQEVNDYRNSDGNKITFILVGTKSDKVFENGQLMEEYDEDMEDTHQKNLFEEFGDGNNDANLSRDSGLRYDEDGVIQTDEDLNDINVMAKMYAKRKGFHKYYATSSLFGTNVKNVFDEAIEQTYQNRMEKLKDLKVD